MAALAQETLLTGTLGDQLIAIRREITRLEALFAGVLAEFERRREFESEGAVSAAAWVRHSCGLTHGAAAERVEIARHLRDLPAVRAGFEKGDLGYQHVAVIARSAGEVGIETVRQSEATLVEAAQRLDPGRLRQITRHLRHCVDPDGTLQDENRAHERRWLHLSQTLDGVWMLDGQFDAESGTRIATAIGALDAPTGPDDGRNAGQRRADAFVDLCSRALDAGELPLTCGQRPHITVVTSAATLGGAAGAPGGHIRAAQGMLVAETVRRLSCDAARTDIEVDADGRPLSVGRTRRTVPPWIRKAVMLRDGGCCFPGCDRPPGWCDCHHIIHWADDGKTEADNLVTLCRRHHRFVHEANWHVAMEAGGRVVITPPDHSARPAMPARC